MVGSRISLARANRRVGHTHTFREHNKEADQKLPVSVDFGTEVAIMAYSGLHGWSTFCKECGPVPGDNSLDADLGMVC